MSKYSRSEDKTNENKMHPQLSQAIDSSCDNNKSIKKGPFIASLICFVLGTIFTIVYVFHYTDILTSATSNINTFGLVILYLILFGWIYLVPAIGLIIASICTSSISIKSQSKKIKSTAYVFLILSIIILISLIISIFLPSFIA